MSVNKHKNKFQKKLIRMNKEFVHMSSKLGYTMEAHLSGKSKKSSTRKSASASPRKSSKSPRGGAAVPFQRIHPEEVEPIGRLINSAVVFNRLNKDLFRHVTKKTSVQGSKFATYLKRPGNRSIVYIPHFAIVGTRANLRKFLAQGFSAAEVEKHLNSGISAENAHSVNYHDLIERAKQFHRLTKSSPRSRSSSPSRSRSKSPTKSRSKSPAKSRSKSPARKTVLKSLSVTKTATGVKATAVAQNKATGKKTKVTATGGKNASPFTVSDVTAKMALNIAAGKSPKKASPKKKSVSKTPKKKTPARK